MNITAAHKVATDIEHKINQELSIMTTVHIEPKDFEHEFD
jgi:divalent metal cation (Fe/Co/Zn/Cd) transporter